MEIALGKKWEEFESVISGDGAESITNDVLNISSGAGSGSAYRRYRFTATPGMHIRVTVIARRISGSDGSSPSIAIDYPAAGSLQNRTEVASSEWQLYTLEYSVPLTSDPVNDFVAVVFGPYTSLGGEAEFYNPNIVISNTNRGAPRFAFGASVLISSSVASIDTTRYRYGMESVSYDSGLGVLTITPVDYNQSGPHMGPLITVTKDETGAANIIPILDDFDEAGTFLSVKFWDTTTDAFVSPTDYSVVVTGWTAA